MSGAILRQMLYGTTRLGVYNSVYAIRKKQVNSKGRSMSFIDRLGCGTIGGMCGAIVGKRWIKNRKSCWSSVGKNDKWWKITNRKKEKL